VVRLVQLRFIEVLVLAGAVFLLVYGTNSIRMDHLIAWKFRINKTDYLAALAADPSPPPKFRVFEWEDTDNLLAIVYDETDEMGREPGARSPEWVARRGSLSQGERWISQPSSGRRTCVRPLGEHFFYAENPC